MNDNDPWLIAFWCLAGVSMVNMLCVIFHFFTHGDFNELRMKLLAILYLTVIVEEASYLPATYNGIRGLCQFMGWLHYYSGFIDVIVILLMSCHYFSFICAEKYQELINDAISKYGILFAFTFPLITLLPFSTQSYGENREIWCTLSSQKKVSVDWAFIIFYCWIILFLIIGNIQFFYALHRLSKLEIGMRKRLFYSSGVYILISTYAWIPRIFMRILDFKVQGSHNIANIITTGQLYVSGLMFGCVYVVTRPASQKNRTTSVSALNLSIINVDVLKNDLVFNTPLNSMHQRLSEMPDASKVDSNLHLGRVTVVERESEA